MSAAAPSPLPTLRFQTDLRGIPGTLVLTATTINWLPEDPQDRANRQTQALNRVDTIFTSKAGVARTSLKITFYDNVPEKGLTFVFTHPQNQLSDRQTVQDRLTAVMQRNREARAAGAANAVAGPSHAGPSGSAASVVQAVKRKAGNDTPGSGASEDGRDRELHELRKRVLRKNPTLKVLHRELVSKGRQITEDEFWDGREAMIQAERMTSEQKPGRPSRLLDDRFGLATDSKKGKDGAGGTGVGTKKKDPEEKVVTLSTELTKEIFEEFPVVQDAWARFVPGISEAAFWTRYFQSQLWEQHRASVRSSNNDDVPKKKDDIFDQYLEEPDWGIEPRTRHGEHIERFLDLDATEEDHGETGNNRDVTMQAGKQRTTLPLIRRFNEHSHRLLHAGRDEEPEQSRAKRAKTTNDDSGELYNEIDLEDLHGPPEDATIPLNVQDRQNLFEGQGGADDSSRGILHGKTEDELRDVAGIEYSRFDNWHCNLARVGPRRPTADAPTSIKERYEQQKRASLEATAVIKEMTALSKSVMLTQAEIPVGILSQVISCHNATCEFLRQYWTAVLPNPPGALNPATPAQKSAKAAKMAMYLGKTDDKVAAIVATAENAGVDPVRIQTALDPTLAAVAKALARESARKR